VGVVDDIREGPLDSDIWPAEYLPMNQSPDYEFEVIARTAQNERSVLPAMIAAVHQIDLEIGIEAQGTMRERINQSPSAYLHRTSAWLVSGFAFVALLLGIVGLYGVVAYSVSQRTREIGIRMALGAERGNVYGLIMGEAGRLTLAGLAGGLVCSLAAAVLMRRLLFGVTSWDLPTLAAVAGLLASAALLASFLPARRAASVNPVDALRAE
jgi:ABC-type antimicrobial peptide transport system permease subunit